MMLTIRLALRDLFFARTYLICNVAVLAGVLVPLMVLFGVKNGVYNALLGDLLSTPRNLQIDTAGNASFTLADAETVRGFDGAGFVTLKTRSQFDFVNVRPAGGREKRDAILIPSGTGDPNLAEGLVLDEGAVAISAQLAEQLGIEPGDKIDVITQAEDRPRQLLVSQEVVGVLPPGGISGRAVLARLEVLDLVEAFYDAYALPDYGISQGKPLVSRTADFEGLRVFAASLQDLAPLQNQIETTFGIGTEARTAEVETVLRLGKNLNLALLLTAGVASLGLAAALVFGFWGEVQRKRRLLAVLSLMGLGAERLWIYPVVQAFVSAVLALAVSFALLELATLAAEAMFDTGLGAGELVHLSGAQVVAIVIGVVVFVCLASLFAALTALRTDPATVLREDI